MSKIAEDFREALFNGMLNAAEVLLKADPEMSIIEVSMYIADECACFTTDYFEHVAELAEKGDLTEQEVDTLFNRMTIDQYGDAMATAEQMFPDMFKERELTEDEKTFSYDNYLEHVGQTGGVCTLRECDPTLYMDKFDADAALRFLANPRDTKSMTTLVERGFAVSTDGTRTFLDLETDSGVGFMPGTVAQKTAAQTTTVIDPDAKPRWWRGDDGELMVCYAPYIPLTVTSAVKDAAPSVIMPVLRDVDHTVSLCEILDSEAFYRPTILRDTDSLTEMIKAEDLTGKVKYPVDLEAHPHDCMDAAQIKGWSDYVTEVRKPSNIIGPRWTVELDPTSYEAMHGLDVEAEIEAALREEIAREYAAGSSHDVNDADSIFVMKKEESEPGTVTISVHKERGKTPAEQTIAFYTRYGLLEMEADGTIKINTESVKAALPEGIEVRTRRFSPRHWGFMEDTSKMEADRADHVHPEPVNIVLTESNPPVHPLQCKSRLGREKTTVEVRTVSFR